MKIRVSLLLVAIVMQAGCSTTDVRLGTPISCDAVEPARLILFAQAVPEAGFIPCVGALPVGWTVESIGTRTGEAVIVFENDAYDAKAIGTLTAACAPIGAASSTDDPSIARYNDGAGRYTYTFAGGCFTMEFPREVSDGDSEALLAVVSYLSRNELRSLTGWTL